MEKFFYPKTVGKKPSHETISVSSDEFLKIKTRIQIYTDKIVYFYYFELMLADHAGLHESITWTQLYALFCLESFS